MRPTAWLAIAAMAAIGSRASRMRPGPRGGGGSGGGGGMPPVPPPGAVLTLAELRELARANGFPDPLVAAAVAMAESGGAVGAVGDVSLGGSYGLWQIHAPSHPEFDPGRLRHEPAYNARAALMISKSGTDWTPWTTYRTGAYLAFMRGGEST